MKLGNRTNSKPKKSDKTNWKRRIASCENSKTKVSLQPFKSISEYNCKDSYYWQFD